MTSLLSSKEWSPASKLSDGQVFTWSIIESTVWPPNKWRPSGLLVVMWDRMGLSGLFLLGFALTFFLSTLFLLAVGDDVGKALVVQVAIGINGSGGHHTVELLLGEAIGLGGEDITEVILGDGALALWVEELEGGEDNILGVSAVKLISQHVQENGEVDGGWGLGHHLVELGGVNGHNTQ